MSGFRKARSILFAAAAFWFMVMCLTSKQDANGWPFRYGVSSITCAVLATWAARFPEDRP